MTSPSAAPTDKEFQDSFSKLGKARSEIAKIIIGQERVIDQTLITRNVTTGETKPLWSGSATALDFAADGSVAIASEAEPEFIPPPGGLPSPEIKPDKPEPAKIIVFRGGDPDSPKLSQLPRRNADIIRYCANRLYVVRATGRAVRREPFDPEEDELFAGVTIGSDARYEVLLLTADGAVERSLAKTKSISIGDVACNGERLLVGTNNLLKIGVLEFGP